MKLRKILAAASAAVIGASLLTVAASANEGFLMYASGDWSAQKMELGACPDGEIDVTGDGTYTVSAYGMEFEDEDTGEMVPAQAVGAVVFCVDITDLALDLYGGKDAEGYADCETAADKMAFAKAAGLDITDVSIQTKSTDGTVVDIPVDQSKILFGDIEGNNKIRLEVYNEYGDSKNDPCIDTSLIDFDDSISVTFTISGLDADAPAEDNTPAEDTDTTPDTTPSTPVASDSKGSPDTGVEGIAAVAGLAVVAGGALAIAKKRK